MEENNVSKNIRQLRTIAKLKQSELAAMLNVSAKLISHWETGYSEPSISQLIALSRIFNVTIDELIL
ncbi:MAG: helix-turn-helix domain-containing protein [Clostridia bacterium]|nr:helix-turn-helix domain-containing protein [Clostridia bacterium]